VYEQQPPADRGKDYKAMRDWSVQPKSPIRAQMIAVRLLLLVLLTSAATPVVQRQVPDGGKLLLYNRIPKTGSASLVTVVEAAAAKLQEEERNGNFTYHGTTLFGKKNYGFNQLGDASHVRVVEFCKHLMELSTPGMYVHCVANISFNLPPPRSPSVFPEGRQFVDWTQLMLYMHTHARSHLFFSSPTLCWHFSCALLLSRPCLCYFHRYILHTPYLECPQLEKESPL
jgi:hypothetical protein